MGILAQSCSNRPLDDHAADVAALHLASGDRTRAFAALALGVRGRSHVGERARDARSVRRGGARPHLASARNRELGREPPRPDCDRTRGRRRVDQGSRGSAGAGTDSSTGVADSTTGATGAIASSSTGATGGSGGVATGSAV